MASMKARHPIIRLPAALRAEELACEATIIRAAKLAGWRVHGERTSKSKDRYLTAIKGHAGWPDLALVRGHEFVVRELKRHPNKVEPEQEAWLAALSFAGINAGVLWVPEQMDDFCQWLADRRPTLH